MLWQRYAKIKPKKIALKFEIKQQDKSGADSRFSIVEKHWNWQKLNALIQQQVVFWQRFGLDYGDGIALIGRYQQALVIAYLAALQLGCRILVINPMFPQDKMTEICQQNELNFVADCQKTVIDSDKLLPIERLTPMIAINRQSEWFNRCPLTLTLTSGSTGLPKAVVHTMEQHLASAKGISPLLEITEESEWLLSLPLFHVSGQGIIWRWLFNGAILRCVGESIYQDLSKVTHTSLVPTQLQQWLNLLQQQPISPFRLSHILLGGSHIPTELTQQASGYGIKCYSGYGMTEMASTVFAKLSDAGAGVGYLLPERECRLEHDEVWVKGATLALGYWQKGQTIKPLINRQGWFPTRDKAKQDGLTGELFILGRFDNMFISGGENIQPEEIEAIILKEPTVRQVFILPIKDQKFGHRPVALIDFIDDFTAEKIERIQQLLQQKIEKFKCPIAYYPLQQITAQWSGIKLSRRLLTQQLTHFLQQEE